MWNDQLDVDAACVFLAIRIEELSFFLMVKSAVKITRLPYRIKPNPSRVITRPFVWTEEPRNIRRIERVLDLPEFEVIEHLEQLLSDYLDQHPDILGTWREHFDLVSRYIPEWAGALSTERELLIGAYFSMEYAIESAALFNPSIIPSRYQDDVSIGSTRFFMSLRATGEGHLSSIVFRRGVIDKDNRITMETPPKTSRPLKAVSDALFSTRRFGRILSDIDVLDPFQKQILAVLGDEFSLADLKNALANAEASDSLPASWELSAQNMLALASSNYRLLIPSDMDPGEMVIFPRSENESRGIEDLRLVTLTEDDGSSVLYGTYTAYNGIATFPTLMESRDPRFIDIHTLAGRYAKNKGMALFPRRINGKYVMSGRLDGECLYILESSNVLVWNESKLSQEPRYWWELSVIGNCGSPIETKEGWLLLTHGVGPMRQYCIGAVLLDLDDPVKVIGRTKEPLMMPMGDERVGYVPNVVYTCGAMKHNDSILIPYAMSDMMTTFALVNLDELLDCLKHGG